MSLTPPLRVLAIETSCDETAVAILEQTSEASLPVVLSSVVSSQVALHAATNGVVPEVAGREHVKNLFPLLKTVLDEAPISRKDLTFIAVTQGPGLIPALRVGVESARALAFAWDLPLLGVNHLEGHIMSAIFALREKETTISENDLYPMMALTVSGGHTQLTLMRGPGVYEKIGETLDDAAGEAFDKIAALLNLGYPGGPIISKIAEDGVDRFAFPRPLIHQDTNDFSFSGLKTAVRREVEKLGVEANEPQVLADLCASAQAAIVESLVVKTIRAATSSAARSIVLAGGVAANTSLRLTLEKEAQTNGFLFAAAPLRLTGDNAVMIGMAALARYHHLMSEHGLQGQRSQGLDWHRIAPDPRMPLESYQ